MRFARHTLLTILLVMPILAVAQDAGQPTNDAPNNYTTIKDYFKLPEGRTWGSTSAVDIDKDGTSIWVAERCGQNSCLDRTTGKMSDLPSVLKFDASGKLVKSFGAGLLIFPHGIHVDKDGNVWVTDGQDDAPLPARGAGGGRGAAGGRAAAPTGPIGPRPGATHGNQVFKFSPEGKVLMTLGKPGGAAAPDYFYQPNDVITAPNGDIFVAEGHGAGNNRILKFDKNGKFIKEWGKLGTGPGEFDQPHALAFDSKGRLFVGDRNNNRDPDLRSETASTSTEWHAVQPPERHLHRQERHPLLGRLGVRVGVAQPRRLEARHPQGQRQGREDHRLHPRSDDGNQQGHAAVRRHERGRRRRRRQVRQHLRRGSRTESRHEIREEIGHHPVLGQLVIWS